MIYKYSSPYQYSYFNNLMSKKKKLFERDTAHLSRRRNEEILTLIMTI